VATSIVAAARIPRAARAVELALDDPRWREFVASSDEAVAFHLPAWSTVLQRCYRYRALALALTSADGSMAAGLPLMEVPRPLRAPRWASLPFTDCCPPLGRHRVSADDLVGEVREAARAAGVSTVAIHAPLEAAGAHAVVEGVTHTLQLGPDPEAVRRTFSRSQVQRNIKRAEREGVVVRRAESEFDLTDTFYRLHLGTRRRQGVPVQPRRFFELLWQLIIEPGDGFVLLADVGGKTVAAAVFLMWNGTVTYKYGASDAASWSVRPNHPLFWNAIRWSCEQGWTTFDFGKTDLDNQGLRDFKSQWGTREEPLVYSVLSDAPPRTGGGRATSLMGTVIRRSPPFVCRAIGGALYRYAA
jgi:CelD/BcsL family acetyltransferase involved in cellulose biosynthesis